MRRSNVVSLVAIVAVAVIALAATLLGGHSPQLGLDLQGGASVVLAPAPGQTVKPGALDESVAIIRRRVNGLGVAGANVVSAGQQHRHRAARRQGPGGRSGAGRPDRAARVPPGAPVGGQERIYDPATGTLTNQPPVSLPGPVRPRPRRRSRRRPPGARRRPRRRPPPRAPSAWVGPVWVGPVWVSPAGVEPRAAVAGAAPAQLAAPRPPRPARPPRPVRPRQQRPRHVRRHDGHHCPWSPPRRRRPPRRHRR